MSEANERQVGGDHYRVGTTIQHWDWVAAEGMDYFQGQITKYVARWKKKNGIQDLEKAAHYLQKYIEIEKAKLEIRGDTLKTPNEIRGEAGSMLVEIPVMQMNHKSTPYFTFIGIQQGIAIYDCRICHANIRIKETQSPQDVHDCGSEPTSRYVDQDYCL